MKQILIIIAFFLQMQVSFSQDNGAPGGSNWILGPSIGYQYQNGNFLKTSFWGLTDLGYANYLKIDAGVDVAWANAKTHVIPELGLTYFLGAKAVWPFVKGEVTPHSITPKVGVSVFSIVDVAAGYGLSIKKKENFGDIEGFAFSVGFNIPLNFILK